MAAPAGAGRSALARLEPGVLLVDHIDPAAPPDGVFFDVGSNWGYFSLLLAARPGFTGRIHAFEPWPTTYADLDSVVSQAGLRNVITTHRLALGACEGQVSMRCGRHSGLAQIAEAASTEQLQTVQQVTLDGLDLPAPDLMKLDVEGAEAAIVEGGRELIQRSRPIIVFEHTPGETRRKIRALQVCWLGLAMTCTSRYQRCDRRRLITLRLTLWTCRMWRASPNA